MSSLVIRGRFAVVGGEVRENLALRVEQGRITGLLDASELRADDQVVDFPAHVLVPGTVNAHAHAFQSLIRGASNDLEFSAWKSQVLFPLAETLSQESLYVSSLVSFVEMLRYGVTTVADFFYPHNGANENAKAVIAAAGAAGIRLVLARGMYDSALVPRYYTESVEVAERNTAALIEETAGVADVQVVPAPHSVNGASREMIKAALRLCDRYDVPYHIHVATEKSQSDVCRHETGLSSMDYLESLGALDRRGVFAHCIWIDEDEIAKLARSGCCVVHNPTSNMFLGDGIAPVTSLLQAGMTVALGTDGACTNNRLSIFDEMRMSALLQKVAREKGSAMTARTAYLMGTHSGGKALEQSVGDFSVGSWADIVAIKINVPALMDEQHLLGNLVYGMSHQDITDVYVAGKHVVRDSQPVRVDVDELAARFAKSLRSSKAQVLMS